MPATGTAGAAQLYVVGVFPALQEAVSVTVVPGVTALLLELTEQFAGTPPVVVGAPSQFSVKLPFEPVTENEAHDALLNVNDAA